MIALAFLCLVWLVEGAIVAPPWADPDQNPCASQPGGWQLLFWPGDGKCYKIFHQGPPCPASMELTPGANRTAECRCPPGSAQLAPDSLCYKLYTTEPCQLGEYFAPAQGVSGERWGVCRHVPSCPRPEELFHPRSGRCHSPYTQGPCPRGQLLAPTAPTSPVAQCRCDDNGRLGRYYWPPSGTCHPHFTSGPCPERGQLFLPEGKCGCHPGLQQYHNSSGLCYQIGTVGPCPTGHYFTLPEHFDHDTALSEPVHAECRCKTGHVQWHEDGNCYRPYTRGPCPQGQMFSVNLQEGNQTASCEPLPCPPGRLYFPGGKGCHRVGSQGPCPPGQVVLFQESVRTSVEGISYQGMCGCATQVHDGRSFYPTLRSDERTKQGGRCESNSRRDDNTVDLPTEGRGFPSPHVSDRCSSKRGYVTWEDGSCQRLYSRGACSAGQWVVPDSSKGRRQGRGGNPGPAMGKCECLPSFTPSVDPRTGQLTCQPPSVRLARYLNSALNTS
ncbi:platelet endothelial aggregation receptor 1-like [Homalodisca vitripennis]|uniref:platelet endothelial aggregation receptor 1-like n=1 Tax=Homalodisca vitripennis TaxID=197043 RepID=UPI001EEAB870|nr:platelet endothelial aggregation receptor 1-like [Homalodisca vitripennis]